MNNKFRIITTLSLTFFLLFSQIMMLAPQDVSAAQSTVLLSGVKGEVLVKKGGGLRELPAADGMVLVQGDWLRTGKTGTAKLIYQDGTEATIGASSSINIQRLSTTDSYRVSALSEESATATTTGHQSSIQLWSGSIWSKVKSLLNMDDRYEVETPTAVMGVRGTLYLVKVTNGATQGDIVEGVVGVTQNKEGTQADPIQLVTMGQTFRLISSDDPLTDREVIDPQELIRTTPTEILVQLVKDILERAKELADLTKDQQQAYGQTGLVDHLKAAIGTSYKLDELATFGKEFVTHLEKSDKFEEVKQAFKEDNQSFEQVQSDMDTLKDETEEIRSEVEETAKKAGMSEEKIEDIGNEATGVSSNTGTVPTPTPTPPPAPTGNGNRDSNNDVSSITTIVATGYLVSSGTISNVPNGTSRATFLSKLGKGESHQSWDTSGVQDPVLNNDQLVVTAQDGTQMTYIISLDTPSQSSLETFVPIAQGVPITFTNGVNLDFGDLTFPLEAQIKAQDVSSSVGESIPDGLELAGAALDFTITGMETSTLEEPVRLTMPLNEGVDPSTVGLYYLNDSGWEYQDTEVIDRTVVAMVTHFSIYAVLSSNNPVNLVNQTVSFNGTELKLLFDQPLHSSSKPALTDFAITSNGSPVNVVSPEVSGNSLNLDLDQPIYKNDLVNISYTVGPYHIRDLEGDSVRPFSVVVLTDSLPEPSSPPSAANIIVTNNVGANDDRIVISGLVVGDVVKVYDAATKGILLGEATVQAGNSTTVYAPNLGYAAGSVWVTVTSLDRRESLATQKVFAAELTLSVAVTPITPDGSIWATVVGEASDHFAVSITDVQIDPPNVGNSVPAVANLINPFISGKDIHSGVAASKYLQVYDLDAENKVVRFVQIQLQSADFSDHYYQAVTSNEAGGPGYHFEDIRNSGSYYKHSDDSSIRVPLDFNFEFYGLDYDEVFVGTNGYLTFGEGDSVYENYSFPTDGLPRIAPFFDDLIVQREQSGVYYLTEGTAPNRRLIVQWGEEDHYYTSPNSIWFEAVLYEGSNRIEFQYLDTTFGDENDHGRSATVGIERGDRVNAIQYSHNYASLTDGFAIAFIPKDLTDITVPIFEEGYPTIANLSANSMDLEIEINVDATAHYLMIESENVSELGTVTADVITSWNGGDHDGLNSWSGNLSLTAHEIATKTFENSSIESNMAYTLYIVAEDMSENLTDVIKIEVTTPAEEPR